ncbi:MULTISPECIES: hypothetical protein [unclassified Lactobacillus]|uniref:hypothetical protein n=1 Tax=unclassified Lactobacillus TaxID=2620435 RepID=UPI000EFC8B96|nr:MULTISPECIES: hypothetical protein [unclassified Lactobacillus]RMC38128.1 hypothetical protein F5ESL0237_07775 [Lactobacillus sp. ESL0237]RMC42661.1 hypothetical protein F5ESL0234_07680 [Lactobacillus sp. ESL0234]RMC43356.1 hypothetical protein F5ESL0236_07800 [Lactobacillus sp. ESL0236]RMC47874.1 hypothetical protein F5ESL0225_08040 [Lactobacillus sp. ESL0225]
MIKELIKNKAVTFWVLFFVSITNFSEFWELRRFLDSLRLQYGNNLNSLSAVDKANIVMEHGSIFFWALLTFIFIFIVILWGVLSMFISEYSRKWIIIDAGLIFFNLFLLYFSINNYVVVFVIGVGGIAYFLLHGAK